MRSFYSALFILFCSFSFAQNITFSSSNLKTRLLNADVTNATAKDINGNQIKIDTNNDTEISINEALQVYELDLNIVTSSISNSINSISGLEHFVNIKRFVIDFYYHNSISFAIFPNLEDLTFTGSTQLYNLNITGIPNLKKLNVSNNLHISTLDFSAVPNLEYLKLNNNNFSGSLDVSMLPNLIEFYNKFESVNNYNFQGLTNLEVVDINSANITTLNMSSNTALKRLDCTSCNSLSSLNITGLSSLEYLNCSYVSNLNSLNLSTNVALKELRWHSGTISAPNFNSNTNLEILELRASSYSGFGFNTLNLSNLVNLKELSCIEMGGNGPVQNLSNLNISGCINLEKLNIEYCSIINLNLSNNIHLKEIVINTDTIQTLNLTGLSELEKLDLDDTTLLTTLTYSVFPALKYIYFQGSGFSNLDLHGSPLLLNVSGNNSAVDFVNLSNSTVLTNLTLNSCPNLEMLLLKNGVNPNNNSYSFNSPSLLHLCVDENYFSTYQNYLNSYSNTQCEMNTYCSSNPGGIYNVINSTPRIDYNVNGCDSNDLSFPNMKFKVTNGANIRYVYSNAQGELNVPVGSGNTILVPNFENLNYFSITPSTVTINFPTQTSPYNQNFCMTPLGIKHDLEVTLIPINAARPGFDAKYKIIYRNKGNQIANGTINLTFDDTILDLISSNPNFNTSAINSLSWNFTNFLPFETREILLTLNVNSPMETPAVNNGAVLNYSANIVTTNTDQTPNDNSFTLNQIVVGSYDPNDKTCLQGETISPSQVNNYVHYIIRFENTGTYPAENIVVSDVVDLTKFDINTLVPLNSSHNFFTRYKDNKVEFYFDGINLPFDDANNDGYISFKIKIKNLAVGSTFSNTAKIYFDYNFPIVTNTYTTTVAALSTTDFDFGTHFTLYPNPVKDMLNFQSKVNVKINSIEIYNTLGQVVLAVPNATTTVDVSSLQSGSYFIKINTDLGVSNTKFVKE